MRLEFYEGEIRGDSDVWSTAEGDKDLILMLGLNETMVVFAMRNGVCWHSRMLFGMNGHWILRM